MKVAARIRRVLAGHSPVALVHAMTDDGSELKLEVPVAEVAGVAAGDVLVVDWWTFRLAPEAEADADADEDDDESAIDGDRTSSIPDAAQDAASTDTMPRGQLRRILGLPT